jgi:cob(I)alamin adenosyltransferase
VNTSEGILSYAIDWARRVGGEVRNEEFLSLAPRCAPRRCRCCAGAHGQRSIARWCKRKRVRLSASVTIVLLLFSGKTSNV